MIIQLKIAISERYRQSQTWFFKTLIKLRGHKILVFVGCGRSGTTFSSRLLAKCGLAVGHERLKYHGVSSWMLVSERNDVPLGPCFQDLDQLEKVVIHQVRNPLPAISSMLAMGSPSWKFLSSEIPIDLQLDSKILRAMKYYYYWNLKAERLAHYRVRVENFAEEIRPILVENQIAFKDRLGDYAGKHRINARQHKNLTWEDLDREDVLLSGKIRELAHRYGYIT